LLFLLLLLLFCFDGNVVDVVNIMSYVPPHDTTAARGPGFLHYPGFIITLRHTTLGRIPWTSDQPDAETSTWQHTTLTRDRHSRSAGIRTHIPSERETANLRPILRDHCFRPCHTVLFNSHISFSGWKYG